MIQDVLSDLIVATFLFTITWAIADVIYRIVNDRRPHKSMSAPPTPQDYREAFGSDFEPQEHLTSIQTKRDCSLSMKDYVVPVACVIQTHEIVLQSSETVIPNQEQEKANSATSSSKKVERASKTSNVVNIAKLILPHARVACRVLGIQQKVNGHDAKLAWMQAQINARLKEQPEKEAEVFAAIKAKYPDVVLPEGDRQQVLTA
jgi:hypothetical protein